MIIIDTSVLVDSFTGPRRSLRLLGDLLDRGERVIMTSIVLYEWLRGPRVRQELVDQEDIFRSESVVAFDMTDAARAADIYKRVRSPRGREIDLAIAAMALNREATIWTLNLSDFADIPDLRLIRTHPVS
jgi:predicted nucleic acid-binding protein